MVGWRDSKVHKLFFTKRKKEIQNSRVHSLGLPIALLFWVRSNLNKLFWGKRKKMTWWVHFVRNYIFTGKVNFEGSLNGWKRCSYESQAGSLARYGVEERREEEKRQLLKAIAFPPGCLQRAESVEMLNLAWHPSWIIVGVGANQRKMSPQFKSCQLVEIRPSCIGRH